MKRVKGEEDKFTELKSKTETEIMEKIQLTISLINGDKLKLISRETEPFKPITQIQDR